MFSANKKDEMRERGKNNIRSTNETKEDENLIKCDRLVTDKHVVSLENVTRIFATLQSERDELQNQMNSAFKERVLITEELRDLERQIAKMQQRRSELEIKIGKVGAKEQDLKQALESLDAKVESIGNESIRFEESIKTIKDFWLSNETNLYAGTKSNKVFYGHNDAVNDVKGQRDHEFILSASSDCTIRVWDINSDYSQKTFINPNREAIESVCLFGNRVIGGTINGRLLIFDFLMENPISTLNNHKSTINVLESNAIQLITGSNDSTMKVFDVHNFENIQTLNNETGPVFDLQFFDYGLASGGSDGRIKLWDLRTAKCQRSFVGHSAKVTALQFDNHQLISGGADETIKVWDLRTGNCIRSANVLYPVTDLSFNSLVLIVATNDHNIKMFDPLTLTQKNSLFGHVEGVKSLQMLDSFIVSASQDKSLRVWKIVE